MSHLIEKQIDELKVVCALQDIIVVKNWRLVFQIYSHNFVAVILVRDFFHEWNMYLIFSNYLEIYLGWYNFETELRVISQYLSQTFSTSWWLCHHIYVSYMDEVLWSTQQVMEQVNGTSAFMKFNWRAEQI